MSDISDSFRSYQKYYSLYGLTSRQYAGTVASDSFTCVAQLFIPEPSSGTVFFLHGYFDHTGTIINGIKTCIEQNYSVAVLDLPGHGLSSGERGAINDFSEYTKAFEIFINTCEGIVDTPFIFMGHSTGCAVGYEYIAKNEDHPFRKAVFLAPLVRSSYYHLSVVGNALMKPFFRTLPRWFRKASHDKAFLQWFREDPLQPNNFPVRWADAYYRWFNNVKKYPTQPLPLTVVQGTGDDVVDWRYNLPFLRNHFSEITIVKIKDARHQLMNETEKYFSECRKFIVNELKDLKLSD